jgi:orotate phosphoribosyltransferase-like protein
MKKNSRSIGAMRSILKSVSEVIAKANDAFYAKHHSADSVMGIMDNGLRKQGIPADAITLECVALDKKMVFLLHDASPNTISVAVGNKAGDIHSSSEHPIAGFTSASVVRLLEQHLA